MVSLTFAYALRLDERIEPFWIVSMMMSAGEVLIVSASLHITASWPAGVSGAIHMKCAALLYYPLLSDRQKDLKDRIATEATNCLTVEEREALEQHGIQTGRSKADEKAKGVQASIQFWRRRRHDSVEMLTVVDSTEGQESVMLGSLRTPAGSVDAGSRPRKATGVE